MGFAEEESELAGGVSVALSILEREEVLDLKSRGALLFRDRGMLPAHHKRIEHAPQQTTRRGACSTASC